MEEGTSRRRLLRAFGTTTAMVWGVSDRVVRASGDARGGRPDRSGATNGTGSGLETTPTPTSGAATETPTTTPTSSNQPPTAAFSYSPAEPVAGEPIEFDASASSDPDGTILVYAWDFDGDGTVDLTGETVTHTYEEPGEYEVVMGVADDEKESDRTRTTIEVVAAGTETASATQAPTESPTETPTPTSPPSPTPASDGLLDGVIGQVGTVIGGGVTIVAGVIAAKRVIAGRDSTEGEPGATGAVHERTACPSCGRSLDGDEKYCTGCGYALLDQRCPECDADLEGDEKFCTRCGHDVSG